MKAPRIFTPGRLSASFLALALAACESAEPPARCASLAGQTLTVGQTAAVTACFEDPNGDLLTYTVASGDPSVATATISETIVTVTAVAPGIATVTITASDPEGLQGHARFAVTVPNRPPASQGTIAPVTIAVGDTVTIDVSSNFSEPDGQTLTYAAVSSDPGVAAATVHQQSIIVSSLAPGTADVTVTATDPGGLSATLSFAVTVPNRGPEARGEIPALTINAGIVATLDMSPYFTDPDGDGLAYTATSSDPDVVAVTAVHQAIIISSLARGTADLTVTATDPGGLSATQSFMVIIPNQSPEARGHISPVALFVGDTLVLDVSPYFSDPEGNTLTYTATTSEPAISPASATGNMVTVTSVASGSAMITVTATDPGGLSATQSFQVTIPNRPPRTAQGLTAVDVYMGYPAELNMTPYFDDPDGDMLTYTATTSSPAVATASVTAATITVTAVSPGTATLMVTARDPGGLEVSQSTRITALPRDPGYFADDFAARASLDNWTLSRSRAEICGGVLNLTNTRSDGQGLARRDHPVTEWSVTTRLGRADSTVAAALVMFMNHDRYTQYIVQIGSGVQVDGHDTNYRFLIFDAETQTYSHPPGLQGKSDAIHDGIGEFSDLTFSLIRRQLVLHADTTRLFRSVPLDNTLAVEITGYALVAWPHDGQPGRTVLFDWFEMDGDLVGGDVQARRSDAGVRPVLPPLDPDRVRIREVQGLHSS